MDRLINVLINNTTFFKEYKKNEIIFLENDFCDHIGIVIKGQVKISSYTFEGNEIIFNIINENMMFGASLIYSSLPFYKGNIISIKDSKIAYIKKDKLTDILLSNNLYTDFLKLLSDGILNEKEKNRVLSFYNLKDRLLYILHINKQLTYNSITELAKRLSVSRECLSRTLSSLIRKQIIIDEGKCIKLKK